MIPTCTLGTTVLLFFPFCPSTCASCLVTGGQRLPEKSLDAIRGFGHNCPRGLLGNQLQTWIPAQPLTKRVTWDKSHLSFV